MQGMPWLTILITLLTFFMSGGAEKKNRGKAIATAALAGVGTYYVTHETDWGQQTLGSLDGVAVPGAGFPRSSMQTATRYSCRAHR